MQGWVTVVVLSSHKMPLHPSIQLELEPQAGTVPDHPADQLHTQTAPEHVPALV